MQLVVDSLLTTYSVVGTGKKTILCLHGWADKGATFSALTKQLIEDFPDHQTVLLDLPGFGGTQTPATAWSVPDYAVFVTHFLKKAKLQPVIIIGHSNGGAIAIHGVSVGLLTPDRLVLIGSAGIREKSAKKTALRLLAKPAKLAIKAAPASTQKRIKGKLYDAIGSDYLVAAHMQETFKNIVAYDVQTEAATIKIPTTLIYGENDTATPPEYGHQFKNIIAHSSLTIIPLATHFVHQEQVYKVAAAIQDAR